MKKKSVAILTSGMGLGVYIPSVILRSKLIKLNVKSQIYVYEEYFTEKALKNMEAYKTLFHKDFRAAVAGHKMPLHASNKSMETKLYQGLLDQWEKDNQQYFLMLSGHWDAILKEYYNRGHEDMVVECLRMDCGVTPSWKSYIKNEDTDTTEWLFGNSDAEIQYKITVDDTGVIPYEQRKKEYFIHGGGWGMGTYRNHIDELSKVGKLHITLYKIDEKEANDTQNQYYYIDSDWKPWNKEDNGNYIFPPTKKVDDMDSEFVRSSSIPYAYEITKNSLAVISKPGGGTMLDSISAATPIIFLPPIAEHESKNAEYFEKYGLGISYDKWKESGYSKDILYKLHCNLQALRNNAIEYTQYLAAKWKEVF